MTYDEKIEIAARAGVNADGPDSWDLMHEDYRNIERTKARAIIDALFTAPVPAGASWDDVRTALCGAGDWIYREIVHVEVGMGTSRQQRGRDLVDLLHRVAAAPPVAAPTADVVTENMRERVRAAIGSVDVQEEDSDNLAVALCTYFSDHLDRPECDYAAEKENDETGWGPWVIERCDVAISRITNAAITAALAARSKV